MSSQYGREGEGGLGLRELGRRAQQPPREVLLHRAARLAVQLPLLLLEPAPKDPALSPQSPGP